MSFPTLESQRFVLTQMSEADIDDLFLLFSNPQVVRYYDLDTFSERQQAVKLLNLLETRYNNGTGIRWAIRQRDTHEFLGTCGYNSWNEKMHNATIGYDVKSAHWGKGIATESVGTIIAAGFQGKLTCGPLHRIQADTIPGNIASERVLRKLGFKEEGTRRDCAYFKASYHDLKCFAVLKPEFNHY